MNSTGKGWWSGQRGEGPVIATAIHDGHALRDEVAALMKLDEDDRLREEDPFTGQAVVGTATHLVAHRSRFEVDLNRARDEAVYLTSEQSWGLDVWKSCPPDPLVERSLAIHDAYYAHLGILLDAMVEAHDRILLLDVHSYNHRRDGPEADPTPQEDAPDINIGTFSMPRERWAFLLEPLMEEIATFDFAGRKLDVRENVAFQGKGAQTRFVHERHPENACAIAFEFKKIYMDEWTGQPDPEALAAMRALIDHLGAVARRILER